MNGLKKRIACIFCAVTIATTALLSCPLRVQATAVPAPVSSEATLEALMILWNLLVNGMIAGGAAEAVGDYDSEKALFDAFLDFANDALGIPTAEDFLTYTPDGEIITFDSLVEAYDKGTITIPEWWVDEWDVDEETGEDVIQLPNEQVWGKYRVGFGDDFASILEAWEERGGGTGDSGEPEEPKEPEFNKIEAFAIGAGFLNLMGEFFTSVFKGEVEGVEPESIFDISHSGYTGQLKVDSLGNYIVQAEESHTSHNYSTGAETSLVKTIVDCTSTTPVACYIPEPNLFFANNVADYPIYFRTFNGKSCDAYTITQTVYRYDIFTDDLTSEQTRSDAWCIFVSNTLPSKMQYFVNIPVFDSLEAADNYLLTGDDSGVLNLMEVEYPALIESIPTTLAPLADVRLSPSTLQQTYTGMKTAYETEVKPNISTDTKTNTETYTETMTETVTQTATQVSPSPTPTPTPDIPETDTEIETETTGTEIDDYKRDLRMVFPFCLPFDFIALLQALDAEPQTPRFEIPFVVPALDLEMTVDLNLSFLDDVMEGLRTIELVGFIVFLIFATGKLIKW